MRLVVLPGDGVGPEVTTAAVRVLRAAFASRGLPLDIATRAVGWAAVQTEGAPLSDDTIDACRAADAVLLGAVGHPDAEHAPAHLRPESGLLALRQALGCWGNLRPARVPDGLIGASALRADRARGTDLVVVRELGGGLYYGEPRGDDRGRAWNTLSYTEDEVRRIAHLAFRLASERRRRVTSVDKANVLETSKLWRRVAEEVALQYPEVIFESMLVDRAAMELALRPSRFDVVLTSNLFGDILSDQAAGVVGSLGALGSASVGGDTDLYEPVHGSAPDIAGTGRANPMGAIASVTLMLRTTGGLPELADDIDASVEACLGDGLRTDDLATPADASPPVGTHAFTSAVVDRLGARVSRRVVGGAA
ncbi:3-isopropylmalate dehydrogenase [Gaopeijia maritima]|uniref:3-isopropylmalate dehydrogenase n=1 Tax=Gaopeijia maritima TaxID=3119007 RepID=UPI003253D2A0